MSTPAPTKQDATRRAHLRDYLVACLCDSTVAAQDLATPAAAIQKIVQVVSSDVPHVLADVKNDGFAGLLRLGGSFCMRLAEQMTKPRSSRP